MFDRVVIKPDDAEEKVGSLYIPGNAQETPQKGEVVAVGPGAHTETGTLVPMSVGVGDRVVYSKYAGSEIKIDGEKYVIVEEENILGTLE